MFGKRLKALRETTGLNMKQMAKCLNISYTTYVGYEKDERVPNTETLIAIADYFGTTMDYLYGRVKNKLDVYIEPKKDTKKEQLIKNYESLNEKGKDKLVKYSKFMLDDPDYQKNNTNRPFQDEKELKKA